MDCRICGNKSDNRVHRAREMMFGTREEFDYIECSRCGTVQIAEVPDLAPHYPANYLSFGSQPIPASRSAIHRFAARAAGRYFTGGRDPVGKLVAEKKPGFTEHFAPSVREIPDLGLDSRILDFGCGNGHLLQTLHYFGFRNLTGADAFIAGDIEYPTGVRILKRALAALEPAYDVIMLHHSFEHLPEPQAALHEIKRLLAPDGCCLVRVPIVNDAWERYGTNWVQMDAPRHLFLFTERALKALAEEAGFRVEKVSYDSTDFQFWGSEQYVRDIPLVPEGGPGDIRPANIFAPEQLAEWSREATRLNAEGRGDAACFYLRHA
ncbi:MAG: class I SAM-dependent methyltransferase [Pyrinomonadaceae bacterium]|nr:class I SAM-dependent methyltransferase [Pyrinomonadaceae bacterium]